MGGGEKGFDLIEGMVGHSAFQQSYVNQSTDNRITAEAGAENGARGASFDAETAETSETEAPSEACAALKTFREWAGRLGLSEADLKVFCLAGFRYERVPPRDSAGRRALLGYLKSAKGGPAKWVLISGLYPEYRYTEGERRRRLLVLYRAVVLLIKRSLAYQAQQQIAERTIYWDPVGEVCRELDLAQSKLSAICKEVSGNSLSQVVDCVRAERIKKLMRAKVKAFVQEYRTHCATLAGDSAEKLDRFTVWKALKATRRWPEFCANSWAVGLGFASYRRMYRACMAMWKQTPYQIEMELIEACLRDEVEVDEIEATIEEIQGVIDEMEGYWEEG